MVQAVVATAVTLGELSRNRCRPEDQPTPLFMVVKNLGCPGIARRRLALHHWDCFLLAPLSQIPRTRIADSLVVPSCRPHHVKSPVRSLCKARIAHQSPLADSWLQ